MSKQQNKPKPKILAITDPSLRTGFGIQSHNYLSALGKDYDCYLIGNGFHYDEPIKRGNYTLLPSGNKFFSEDVLPYVLQTLNPEILITQVDVFTIAWLPNMLKQMPRKPIWILYPVIDGHVWNAENENKKWPGPWTEIIKAADVVVGMTDYGKEIILANGVAPEKVSRIYHGVDTQLFRPFLPEQREALKKEVGMEGKFVVGGVFKNMTRKNPEKYLQAFKVFRKGKEDKVCLYLHTPPNGGQGEFNLISQAQDLGLVPGKDVFFGNLGLPYGMMPSVYNVMDVFWALGGMEGFCVPLIEAMACGTPVVALEATTFPEILAGSGILTSPPVYPDGHGVPITFGSFMGVEGQIPNPFDVAKKTEQLYQDKALRERLACKEIEQAITRFDWSVVNPQWKELVKKYIVSEEDLPAEWQAILQSSTSSQEESKW